MILAIKKQLNEKIANLISNFNKITDTTANSEDITFKKNNFCVKLLNQIIRPHLGKLGDTHVSKNTLKLMFKWINNWSDIVNENLKAQKVLDNINKETGISEFSGEDLQKIPWLIQNVSFNNPIRRNNLNQSVPNDVKTPILPTFYLSYPNKKTYYEYVYFVSGFWILFLNNFILPETKIEINNTCIKILQPSEDIEFCMLMRHTDSLITIPLDFLDKAQLTTLYAVSELSNYIFYNHLINEEKFYFSECKLNMFLTFQGTHIIKHYLLLMVSGLLTFNYHQIFFIYHTIRMIVGSFPIVRMTYHNSNAVPTSNTTDYTKRVIPKEVQKNMEDQTYQNYLWMLKMYNDLVYMEQSIWFYPEILLDCVIKYCECSPNVDHCCSICHSKCCKWNTLEPDSSFSKFNAHGLRLFLGYSRDVWPNVLLHEVSKDFENLFNSEICTKE